MFIYFFPIGVLFNSKRINEGVIRSFKCSMLLSVRWGTQRNAVHFGPLQLISSDGFHITKGHTLSSAALFYSGFYCVNSIWPVIHTMLDHKSFTGYSGA